MNFEKTPSLVLKEVFLLLPKKDRLQLQLVSKHLREILLPLIWESYDEEIIEDCFERPLDALYLSKYGKLIKHMHVNLSYPDLLLSLVHCPNLNTISFIKIYSLFDLNKFLLSPPSLVPHLTKVSVSIEFPLEEWPDCTSPFINVLEDLELLFASSEQKEVGLGFLKSFSSSKLKRLLLFTYKDLNLNIAINLQANFINLTHLYIDGCFTDSSELLEHCPKFENLELLDIPANGISLDPLLIHYFGGPANLPKLKSLALTELPTNIPGQPSFIFDNIWSCLTSLHAEISSLLTIEQVNNLKSIKTLRLNFKTEESVSTLFNLISNLKNLESINFSGKLSDAAFDFPSIPENSIKILELTSRENFGRHLINWLVSLSKLEVLKLPRIRVLVPKDMILPFGIHFPKLSTARVFKENLDLNSWIIHSAPKMRHLRFSG